MRSPPPLRPRAKSSRSSIGGKSNEEADQNCAGAMLARRRLPVTVRILSLVGLFLVAAFIAADAIGYNLAGSDPEAALLVAPWQSVALDEQVQKQLSSASGKFEPIEDLARRALFFDPLDSRSLSLLGMIAERKGDLAGAQTLISLSAARSWRNPEAHVWLFGQAIRRGNWEEALVHADGLLRLYPGSSPKAFSISATTFPIMVLFGFDPRGLAALEGALAANPPWRREFLSRVVVNGANDPLMTQLYRSLTRSNQPPTASEMKPYLERLIQAGRFDEAYQEWRTTTNSQAEAPARYLYNGNFEAPFDGSPFNWVFDFVSGAEIQITETRDGEESRALRVEFSGARASLGRVGQLLMLTPGNYRLELAEKASSLRTERGLIWQISCAESRSVLAETSPLTGTVSWTQLKVKFTVPASDCQAQWLKLIIPARTASESEIEGEAWFKGFRVTAEALTQ